MNGKQEKETSQTSTSTSPGSKENLLEAREGETPRDVCTDLDPSDSARSTSEGTPTCRTPLEAAMMQSQLGARQPAPKKPMKTPIATLCARSQVPQQLARPSRPQQVLQNLTNKKGAARPYPGGFDRTSGMKSNPFGEIRQELLEEHTARGVPAATALAYQPLQTLQASERELGVLCESIYDSGQATYGEPGIFVDQQQPLVLLKRHQLAAERAHDHDQSSLGYATEPSAQHQVFGQGLWPTSTGLFSQAGDSSLGEVSSDQERMGLHSLGQSRGMNSDGLLQSNKSQANQSGKGEVPWQFGAKQFRPVECFVQCVDGDGDQKATECQRRGSSTTGTRTTGGTTYNSECSSPKGGAGLSFSQQASFGPLAGNNTFICNGQSQLLDIQNQAMHGLGHHNAQTAATSSNKPPLSPFPKQSEKFKNQIGDAQQQKDQILNDTENTFMSPPIEKVNKVLSYAQQKPFQISLIHNPQYFENEQNKILNSKEDKQFFEDLQVIQSANKQKVTQKSLKKAKVKMSNKKQSNKKPGVGANLSQDGNTALSFKSVTSYVLGDLDISKGEGSSELGSFEISSNSSSIHSDANRDLIDKKEKSARKKEPTSAFNKSAMRTKRFLEDEEQNSGFLANEAYQGFIAEKSPFSFKNPIFFSCPNSKFAMKRGINTHELHSKRQLFADKGYGQRPVQDFQKDSNAQNNAVNNKLEHISNLQTRISKIPQIDNFLQEQSQPSGPLFQQNQGEFVQESDQEAILKHAQDRINQNLQEIKTLQILQKKVLVGGSVNVQSSFRQQLRPEQDGPGCEPEFNSFGPRILDLQHMQQKSFLTPVVSRQNSHTFKPLALQKVCSDSTQAGFIGKEGAQVKFQKLSNQMGLRSQERRLKQDAVESPNSKMKYKMISKHIDELEKSETSFKDLVLESMQKIQNLDVPKKTLWRIFLDLADYAKRESKFDSARQLYKLVVCQQPFAYQGWLEYAKMEEECGNQEESNSILLKSLKFNKLNENLFVKVVKFEEKKENIESIRALVDSIKKASEGQIDQIWRVLLEGALCEGRLGYREEARKQFQYLMLHCRNNGAVFLDASRFEEREDQLEQAIDICEQGLHHNLKHTPLWFQYLKLYEKADDQLRSCKFDKFCFMIRDMFRNIGKDYHWKINVELAQTSDRLRDAQKTKEYLALATTDCPDSVKWKIWLIAARLMQNQGQLDQARLCIERSCMEVPLKQISLSLLEYAKYFEMIGDNERALEIMQRIRAQSTAEWKIQFEAVMMYMRMGKFQHAETMVKKSLKSYFAKGRLWAVLIQLQHQRASTQEDFQEVCNTFKQAVNEISKSGEVWCEGARLYLTNHPANPYFDVKMALRYLDFAVQFTPQYGDSFLEVIRACFMLKKMQASGELQDKPGEGAVDPGEVLKKTHLNCLHSEPNYGVLWFYYKTSMIDNAVDIWKNASVTIQKEVDEDFDQAGRDQQATNWLGSRRLNVLMENGMKLCGRSPSSNECTYAEKIRVVYGFEQILPQNSSKKGEN